MPAPERPPESPDESPAYDDGWAAYQQDLDRTDNPYDAQREPTHFKEWIRGWRDALDEDEAVEQ